MRSCIVPFCQNRGSIPGLQYFRVTESRRERWLTAIGRKPDDSLSTESSICSIHFKPVDDFLEKNGKRGLKLSAIPTLKLRPVDVRKQLLTENRPLQLRSEHNRQQPSTSRQDFGPLEAPPTSQHYDPPQQSLTSQDSGLSRPQRSNPSDPADVYTRVYNCSQCSHEAASVFQLNHHMQRKHGNVHAAELFHAIVEPEQFPCICCDYKSYYHFELYEHCKQTHDPTTENNEPGQFRKELDRYPCEYCRYKSDFSLSLIKHREMCEKIPSRVPSASVTRTLFGSVEEMEFVDMSTLDSGEEVSGFECKHCSYRARRKSNLRKHMLNKHGKDEEIRWFQCNHCSFRTKYKSCLKTHMLKHATDEEIAWFQCSKCSYRAKKKTILKQHVLHKHAKDEEISWFQCSFCPYRAKRKTHLKTHLFLKHATDQEIVWFQCSYCSYRSKLKGNLHTHMLQHSEGIGWLQCDHCSYRAKMKYSLKQHILSKHATDEEISWFHCVQCSYRAKVRPTFRRHVLMKHATDNN